MLGCFNNKNPDDSYIPLEEGWNNEIKIKAIDILEVPLFKGISPWFPQTPLFYL